MLAPKLKTKERGVADSSTVENSFISAAATQPVQCRFASANVVQREEGSLPEVTSQSSNETGMPNQLKSGLENLSGYDLSSVRVHYNSPKPKQLGALAYAQGTNIHLEAGQEKHLPHEGWHVVQQMQGRVKPTMQMKSTSINNEFGLEREADIMGGRALQKPSSVNTRRSDRLNQSGNQGIEADSEIQLKRVSGRDTVVQLLPDMNELFYQKLRRDALAAPAPPGVFAVGDLIVHYIQNPANAGLIPAAVVMAINAHIAGGGATALVVIRPIINAALAGSVAMPGQYAVDTAHNAALTTALEANLFIQTIMDGTVHGNVPGRRGAAPAAVPNLAVPANADDRVIETTDLFNRLTDLPVVLPPVNVNRIRGPHAAMNDNGQLDLGWAAARGNILHEFGHHLENNLNAADFATVHNFLRARTRAAAAALPPVVGQPEPGMSEVGYVFEGGQGYDIDMPEINAGGLRGRRTPNTLLGRFKRAVAFPFKWLKEKTSRLINHFSVPRYLSLVVLGLIQQVGRLLSWMTRRREVRNFFNAGVENFFVHNANNERLSYSTLVHGHPLQGGANPFWYTGSTEYLSTTIEFLNRPSHFRELVRQDPLRVCLFLYVGNRPIYTVVNIAYQAAPVAPGAPVNPSLDTLIHAV